MEAGEYGLTRGACFVACRLEVVARSPGCCGFRCVFDAAGFFCVFFFKQKTAYEIMPSLVGSEMCIRDSSSIDPGFVEIGLVQLSKSVKTTNVTHTNTHRQTDGQTHRLTKCMTPGILLILFYS